MAKAKKTKQVVQARPPEHEHASCKALGQVLDRIGDKWTVMVVGGLSNGPMRFNALLRLIAGVSHRMLTLTLRGLEHDGLVKRTVYPSVPAKVEYELTDVGRSLIKPLSALSEWVQGTSPRLKLRELRKSQSTEWRTLQRRIGATREYRNHRRRDDR